MTRDKDEHEHLTFVRTPPTTIELNLNLDVPSDDPAVIALTSPLDPAALPPVDGLDSDDVIAEAGHYRELAELVGKHAAVERANAELAAEALARPQNRLEVLELRVADLERQ